MNLGKLRNLDSVIDSLPSPQIREIPKPNYLPREKKEINIALAVSSMKDHMTDEGWQIMLALKSQNYRLCGHKCDFNTTDVPFILNNIDPTILVLQDKREWYFRDRKNFREKEAEFKNYEILKNRNDIFKLTILKDSHQGTQFHHQSATEINCHAWIIYYHPLLVKHLAPYVRLQNLVRTYHTISLDNIPSLEFVKKDRALLSGAMSVVYPLRRRIKENLPSFSCLDFLPHPNYHRKGTHSNQYLHILNKYKVAICTSSIYSYALRKIIEASSVGCIVVTDLIPQDNLPEIDENLIRIDPNIEIKDLSELLEYLCYSYDAEKQRYIAEKTRAFYNYENQGKLLHEKINKLRIEYNN